MSISIVVDAEWDSEAMASPDVGLFTEAKTLDELQKGFRWSPGTSSPRRTSITP
jgi:hypothetical protein